MIRFGWKHNAGLVSLIIGKTSWHFGVQRSHWYWGVSTDEYAQVMDYYGLGPFVLVCVLNY